MRLALCSTPESYAQFERMTLNEVTFCYQSKLRNRVEEQITRCGEQIFQARIHGVEDVSSLEKEMEQLQEEWEKLSFTPTPEEEKIEMNVDDRIRAFVSRTGLPLKQQEVK